MQKSLWLARVAALWLGACLLVLVVTGTPGARPYDLAALSAGHITTGFWPPDQGEDRSFQWTKGEGLLRLHGYQPAGALIVALQMTSIQAPGAVALPLTIERDGQPLLNMPVQPAWRTYHILTTPATPRWQTPQLALLSSTTRIGAQDQRELGVAFSGAWVTPAGSRQMLPLFERAAFFATLLTLLFLVLQRLRRPALAWMITLGACALLLVASLLRPAELAYLAPPLWHLLIVVAGLSTVGLAQSLAARVGGSGRWIVLGVLLGLAGQLLLRMQPADLWLSVLGGALLLGGGALAAAALPGMERDTGTSARESAGGRLQPWMLLAGCVVLALGLRLYQLGSVPFGMWRDEARHALLALRILDDPSFRPVYVPDVPIQVDLPALLFYLQAIPITLLGPTVVAARLVPALAGSLTVIPIYILGRRLGGRPVGLVAALLLAVSSWHIALSRFASPAVLDPFFTLTGLVLLDRALSASESTGRQRRLLLALAAGAIMALALYTYHTGRLMPLIAATLIAARLGLGWRAWRQEWTTLAAFALGAILVASPLLHYIWTAPDSFNRRINQIGSVAETESQVTPAYALEENATRYALMWNVQGERNARHHVPLVPLVDPFTGLLFVIGLILLLRNGQLFSSRLLLILLVLGLVPGLLSSDAPHALRSIDVVAPTMLIAAIALAALAIHARRSWPALRLPIGVGVPAASMLFNIWLYFGHTPYDPRIWDKFEYTRETAIGSYLRQSDDRSPVVLPQLIAETDVIRYLAYDLPVQSFNIASPPSLPSGTRLLIPSDADADTWQWVERAVGSATRRQPMRPFPGTDQPTFWLVETP
ncbi:MAG TPA: glycosyltransferase family 39 protein [Herpetosiphonaceae bacterium]